MAYVYLLLPHFVTTSEYLKSGSRQIAKTKSSYIPLNFMFDLPHFLFELSGLLPVVEQCSKYKMDLHTNGVVITDAIKFVQAKKAAQNLAFMANLLKKNPLPG
jgi:hypothetical protein